MTADPGARPPALHFVVPGPLDQRTGGYIYDARMVSGLRTLGWHVAVHSLEGRFPDADARASESLAETLAAIPAGARVLLDGLGIGAAPGPLTSAGGGLRLLALVHHPLSDETGLDPATRSRFFRSEREALAACRGVVVTSSFTARRLRAFDVPATRIRVVRPGTEPVEPAAGPTGAEPPLLLCVGSVVPRKGQRELVRALSRLREASWICVCVGSLERDPAYVATVEGLIGEAGLHDRVRCVGEVDSAALDGWYRRASLFVLPSHYEGYGMALADALAHGLGVVSTTGGAIPDTVPAGAATLVPPGDVGALANTLRALLSSEDGAEERARLAAAARRHATQLPDWGGAAETFSQAIRGLSPDGDL